MRFLRKSLFARLISYFLLLAVVPLVVVGAVAYYQGQRTLRDNVLNHLTTTATLKEDEINRWVESMKQDVQLAAQVPVVQEGADKLLTLDQETDEFRMAHQSLQDYLKGLLAGKPDFLEVLLLKGVGGQVLMSTNPEHEGDYEVTSSFFTEGRKGLYVQSVYPSATLNKPAMTVSLPVKTEDGQVLGVLAVHLNLDRLDDIMLERGGLGATGETYLVDKFNVFVSEARAGGESFPRGVHTTGIDRALLDQADGSGIYDNYRGVAVLGAYRWLEDQGVALLAEIEVGEALAPVRQMAWALIIEGVVVAGLVAVTAYLVTRQIARPISRLTEAATQMAAGDLSQRAAVERSDEIGTLGQAFDGMADQLAESISTLEQRVADRTNELEQRAVQLTTTTEQTRRRTVQLETNAEVARAITSVRDLDRLLPQVTKLISERFGWYHVGIFLVDEAGEYAVLRAANSEGGQRMLERGHRLKVGEVGIVGYATGAGQPRIALDVGHDAVYFDNPDLPETRSEMALPLKVGERVIGALDVQSTEAAAYDQDDVAVLSTLADQVAVAIENARLFDESRQALREVQAVHRQYLQQEWSRVVSRRGQLTYEYRDVGMSPLADFALPEIEQALSQGEVVSVPSVAAQQAALAAPIKLREQTIGVVDLQETGGPRYWSEDEVALVKAVSDQVGLALENVRLLEAEHQQRIVAEALREAAVTLSGTLAFDELLGRILEQVGRVVPCDASNLMMVVGDEMRAVAHRGYEQFGAAEAYVDLRIPLTDMWTVREMRATGRPVLVADTASHPQWMVTPGQEWLRSYIGAPIVVRGQFIGALNVDSSLAGFFTQEQADQLAAFASQSAIALQNARLMDETQRRAEQMASLNRIGLSLTSGLEMERVLDTLYEQCQRAFAIDSFYVALYDAEAGTFHFPFLRGEGSDSELPLSISPEGESAGLTGYVIRTGQPLNIPDMFAVPADALYHVIKFTEDEQLRSYLGVPMIFRGQVTGVISIQSLRPNAYSEPEVELLATIAAQTSIAIENARAYQRLVQTADELRELDRMKTQFLANMSHELRTPLNSIIGFSRVMLKGIDGALTDLQSADLTSIYNSGQHLLRMINDILDMSKIEAGRMDLSFDEMGLDEIFQSVLSTARALVKDRPIELKAVLPEGLPSVWADGQRLRQVLINLLSNAAKFTEEGQITLQAEAGPEFVTMSVSDTGIGIDSEAQRRLFIPFQQVDASTTRRAGGTGLGLSICRNFVEMQGGRIWVESELGKGSTFYFTVPIYGVIRRKMEGEADAIPDKRKKVVLAIDDDTGVITLFKRYLEHDDYQVIGVTQSRRALEVARRLAPDLTAITLDVVMPQTDGWHVLSALKEDPITRDVPVIMCSIVEGLERAMGMGAAVCLNKPVTRDEMLAALERVGRHN